MTNPTRAPRLKLQFQLNTAGDCCKSAHPFSIINTYTKTTATHSHQPFLHPEGMPPSTLPFQRTLHAHENSELIATHRNPRQSRGQTLTNSPCLRFLTNSHTTPPRLTKQSLQYHAISKLSTTTTSSIPHHYNSQTALRVP
jgi:recombinational DNA repair protein (RecF pathway)